MSSYIYGENKLMKPIFVSFDMGYKNFRISIGDQKLENSWKVKILKEVNDTKELKKGVRVNSDFGEILVKKEKVFLFIESIKVYLNEEAIKGHEYIS